MNILDGAHIEGEFYIDVTLHLEEEERGIGNDLSIVHRKTMNFMLYISVPTMIFWIAIVMNYGLIAEFLEIVLTTGPVLHAGCIRLMVSTWAMSHHIRDQSEQPWVCLRVWEFYRNDDIHFSRSDKLILPLKPYEKMHVWQTSLLKFNGVNPSHCRVKHLLFDNQVNPENLLLMKDM